MSKFIELTSWHNREKFFQNIDYIRRVDKYRQHSQLYLSNKEEIIVMESYEDVCNMIKFEPEVADIMRENKVV